MTLLAAVQAANSNGAIRAHLSGAATTSLRITGISLRTATGGVPECLGVFYNPADPDRSEFCIVLEDFTEDEFACYDQAKAPMSLADIGPFLDGLAGLHATCWNVPVDDNQPGLGQFNAHFESLDAQFPETWKILDAQYADTFGHTLWSNIPPEHAAAVKGLSEILAGSDAPEIRAALLKRFRSRPRSICHGDARGQNVFRSVSGDRAFALIDWQMWVAGPVAYEMNQVWMNSFTPDSGVLERFEDLIGRYHATLVKLNASASEYPLDLLIVDIKLSLCQMWMQYVGLTCGMLADYKKPENDQAARNWDMLMTRNCTTLAMCGSFDALRDFVAQLR